MSEHYLKVTRNVSQTCRFFGISRTTFYTWFHRFEQEGAPRLRDRSRRPNMIHYQVPPEVIALMWKGRRKPPAKRPTPQTPGEAFQVDVKFVPGPPHRVPTFLPVHSD